MTVHNTEDVVAPTEQSEEGLEFNVSHLLRADVGATLTECVDLDEPLVIDDLYTSHIAGTVQLIRTNFGILARAKLMARLEMECDRCLDPFIGVVKAVFAEEYLPVVDVSTGRPVQSERTDETFLISPNHVVDLTEATRQHLILAIPMHKLCSEMCQGLCPTCGCNLNVRHCGCVHDEDHPLSAIAALLRDAQQT